MSAIAAPAGVRFEHRTDDGPVLGIGTAAPRLSWTVPSADPVRAGRVRDRGDARRGEPRSTGLRAPSRCWCRGRPPLASRETALGSASPSGGTASDWSEPATVEVGLLDAADWPRASSAPRSSAGSARRRPCSARPRRARDGDERPAVRDRARRLRGHVNGRRVGDQVLAPGWTRLPHRLRYQTYDVTDLIRAGANELEVLLANGWFRGRLGWRASARALRRPAGAARPARGDDRPTGRSTCSPPTGRGPRARAGSSPTTSTTASAPTCARRPLPSGDQRCGRSRSVDARPRPARGAGRARPMRVTEVAARAVEVSRSPSGATLVDFGQNLVGWVRLRVRGAEPGARSSSATPRCSSTASSAPGRCATAKATDTYLLAGGGEEVLEPPLHVPRLPLRRDHGVEDRRGRGRRGGRRRLATCAAPAGSSPPTTLLEPPARERRLEHARQLPRLPTDCPQRDERLGWTGDIQVFAPDRHVPVRRGGFLSSWLADLAAEQTPDGSVPLVDPRRAAHAGADGRRRLGRRRDDRALTVLYERFGDLGVLERQYASMRAWVDRSPRWPAPTGLWTGRIPARRLARPDGSAGQARPGAGRPRHRRDRLPRALGRPSSPRRRRCSAGSTIAARYERAGRARSAARSRASTSPPAGA